MRTKKTNSAQKKAKKTVNNPFSPGKKGFFFIGGPCVIENKKMAEQAADALKGISLSLGIPFIFKASYDKANRTSAGSFRGPGPEKGLKVLAEIRKKHIVPVLTDVHSPKEAEQAAKAVDILQIPAFLCRQTDLVEAAAKTGGRLNIKKGQFVSPAEMKNVVDKAVKAGNKNIWVTERGFSFGYNDLVVDMRSIMIMKKMGFPVIIDATHGVQKPGGGRGRSSGDREYAERLAAAAIAAGADGLFMEVHPDPKKALSDSDTQIPLGKVKGILKRLKKIYEAVNG